MPVPPGVDAAIASYETVSCATPTSCTAAGAAGNELFLTTGSSGSWSPPSVVALPANSLNGWLDLTCPAVGSCLAVGGDQSTSGGRFPLIVSESSGSWGAATTLAAPGDAITGASEQAQLATPWCASAGNCEVAGFYETTASAWRVMAAVETAGSWGPLTALPGSMSSRANVLLACTAIGDCTAIAGDLTWSESAGTWGSPMPFGVTSDPHETFQVSDLACTGSSTCIAVGYSVYSACCYQPSISAAAYVETSGGAWTPTSPPFPELSPNLGDTYLSGISCVSEECVAVGWGDSGYDLANYVAPIAVTWSGGTWSSIDVEQLVLPGLHLAPASSLGDVACADPTAMQCVAVGADGFYSASGAGPTSLFPYSTAILPVRPVGVPDAPIAPYANAEVGEAIVSWSAPADDGGHAIQSYTATVWPGGGSCTAPRFSCAITGLRNGVRYLVALSDANGTDASPAVFTHVIVGAPPSAPSHLLVRSTTTAAAIGWHPATSPPGEPVLRYEVLLGPSGQKREVCVTTADSCTISGLGRNDSYAAWVEAIDASGASLQTRIHFVARAPG